MKGLRVACCSGFAVAVLVGILAPYGNVPDADRAHIDLTAIIFLLLIIAVNTWRKDLP